MILRELLNANSNHLATLEIKASDDTVLFSGVASEIIVKRDLFPREVITWKVCDANRSASTISLMVVVEGTRLF